MPISSSLVVVCMPFVNDKYGDATAESIQKGTTFCCSSRKEQHSVVHPERNNILLFIQKGTTFCCSFSVGKRTLRKYHSLWCVQYMVTSVLQDQQYMFCVRSLLVDEKVVLMKRDLGPDFQKILGQT